MDTVYRVTFFCHMCGLENAFTYQCAADYFEAVRRATTFSCPSGCGPERMGFELTRLAELGWEAAAGAHYGVFH